MLARTPPTLSRPLAIVKLIFLLLTGGALLGSILGTLVSLAFPENFISILASSAAISGLGLVVLGATDAENIIKALQPDPQQERQRTQSRLARLRKPSWKGMGLQMLGALACTAAATVLVFIPGTPVPHFLSAFILLRVPGRVVRSVGGKWERVIGESLTSVFAFGLAAIFSTRNPGVLPTSILFALAGFPAMDIFGALRRIKKDYELMKKPEFFVLV